MRPYHTRTYYDVLRDAQMQRVSVYDERGGEFWAAILAAPGARLRAAREKALAAIDAAMERGEPGEVRV